eukprot:1248789-Pyramimonas_sp.AAC.1
MRRGGSPICADRPEHRQARHFLDTLGCAQGAVPLSAPALHGVARGALVGTVQGAQEVVRAGLEGRSRRGTFSTPQEPRTLSAPAVQGEAGVAFSRHNRRCAKGWSLSAAAMHT